MLDWIAISQSDWSAKVVIGPERRPEVANPALVFMASEARDIANLLSIEAEEPRDLSVLDNKIREATATWISESDASAE